MKKITKAVFPVAGLGTRFLPATKANPKEMLPIVDKPIIQYAVEEAIEAGIKQLIFVTSIAKRSIEDHFDTNYELEHRLEEQGKTSLLRLVQNIVPEGIQCLYVRQAEPRGLGHAVLCAEDVIGDNPFVVILADDLIKNSPGCLKQMVDYANASNRFPIAVEAINPLNSSSYGMVGMNQNQEITSIVEKPEPADAPSNLAVVGRYVLPPEIFECIRSLAPGRGGEIQLTDAIAQAIHTWPFTAYKFQGQRFDCGSKLGYLQATIRYGCTHPEVGAQFRAHLKELLKSDESMMA